MAQKARRTPWYYILISFLAGLVLGILLALLARNSGVELLGASWVVPIVLVILSLVTLYFAWTVRKYVKGETRDLDPKRGVNTLMLSKSMEIVGSILFGWYLGQLIVIVIHPDSSWARRVILECAISAAAALLALVCGIVGEYWCQLPPSDGPENPRVQRLKNSKRNRKAEPVAGKENHGVQSHGTMEL
jgi:DMSO reductase anchor subunit